MKVEFPIRVRPEVIIIGDRWGLNIVLPGFSGFAVTLFMSLYVGWLHDNMKVRWTKNTILSNIFSHP
jgi:hypothetical protein